MPFPYQLPRLLTAAMLTACLLFSLGLPVVAKSKKSRRATAQTKSKSLRDTARFERRNRHRIVEDDLAFKAYPAHAIVPDNIEVIESGSSNSAAVSNLLSLPKPNNPSNLGSDSADLPPPVKHVNVKIDQSRTIEIQQALASRGFYRGEMSGIYDEATIDAMRRFQTNEKISVTGYPTAHALKRLGLGSW